MPSSYPIEKSLPRVIWTRVYQFDPTFRLIFDTVLKTLPREYAKTEGKYIVGTCTNLLALSSYLILRSGKRVDMLTYEVLVSSCALPPGYILRCSSVKNETRQNS